jgi:hypothetical protein
MSEWITDRLPTQEDAPYGNVLVSGRYTVGECNIEDVALGDPWMPMPAPKPKRWTVQCDLTGTYFSIMCNGVHNLSLPVSLSPEDAQRIEDLFNEVMR